MTLAAIETTGLGATVRYRSVACAIVRHCAGPCRNIHSCALHSFLSKGLARHHRTSYVARMEHDAPNLVATSITMSPDLRARLDALARRERRSRSFLAAQAIAEFLVRREHDRAEDVPYAE